MPHPEDFSLETILDYAREAILHAHAHIKAGNTWEKSGVQALRKGVTAFRTLIAEQDSLEQDVSLFKFEEFIATTAKYSLGNCSELSL